MDIDLPFQRRGHALCPEAAGVRETAHGPQEGLGNLNWSMLTPQLEGGPVAPSAAAERKNIQELPP